MNEQLFNELISKHNADAEIAKMKLALYGGMYYSILANKHWKTPTCTSEDKIRDLMNTNSEQKVVVEYVVRHDFPHLILNLEK